MLNYLGSNLIKVYPSGYRGDNINYEASVNSEENLNSLASRLVANKNYIVEAEESSESGADNKIIFVIKGYLFSTNKSNITALFAGASENTIIYASVKTVDVITTVAGASGTYKTLIPYDNTVPAVLDSGNVFKGVYFSAESGDLALYKNVSNKWSVVESSKLIFSTSQIQDGVHKKAMNEEFHVEKLYGKEVLESTESHRELTINSDSSDKTILSGSLDINNQSTGFKISGGNKVLDIQADVNIKGGTNIYTSLDIGASGDSSKITIKQSHNKTLDLIGASLSNQTVTFNGNSTFYAGLYKSVVTPGEESITVAGSSINVVTRDTNQSISADKTHSGKISITNSGADAFNVTGTSNLGAVNIGSSSNNKDLTIYGNINVGGRDNNAKGIITSTGAATFTDSVQIKNSSNYVNLGLSNDNNFNININGNSFKLNGTINKTYNLGNVIQFVSFENGILTLKKE